MAKKTIIQTSAAPAAIGAFSQAVAYGGLLFVSGQIGVDAHTGDLVDGGVDAQTRQAMRNIRAILTASGLDLSHVLRVSIQLRNMSDYNTVNSAYGGFFDENPPARTCHEVSRLPKEALVQIEVVAAAPAPEAQEFSPYGYPEGGEEAGVVDVPDEFDALDEEKKAKEEE